MPRRNLCDEQGVLLENGAVFNSGVQKQNSLSSVILRVALFPKLKFGTPALTNT